MRTSWNKARHKTYPAGWPFEESAGPIILRGYLYLPTVYRKSFATTVHKEQEAEEGQKKMASIFGHPLINNKLEEQAQAPIMKKEKINMVYTIDWPVC